MIVLSVQVLSSFLEKSRGLIGAPKPYPVLFKTRWGIHTFGVRFPLDIVILDKHNQVKKIAKSLGPNQLFFWLPYYDTVIELPAGAVQKYNIAIGKTITLVPQTDKQISK